MADEPNVAGDAGGEAAPAPVAAKTEVPVADKTVLTGADPAEIVTEETPDWRASLAGTDEALLKQLGRFASPENFVKSYRELQTKLRTGQTAATLPEGATPEEVAAHRKALGIPEKADGYGIAYPETLKPTEADTAALTAFQEYMHEHHVPPAAAKAAFDFYLSQQQAGQEARGAALEEEKLNNLADLRSTWKGREFVRNTSLAKQFLGKHFEGMENDLEMVLTARLPNGLPIGDFAPFVKGIVQMARSYADEEALHGGDGGGGGKSMDDEYKELIDRSASSRLSAAENKRLHELAEARHAREARQGRSRAA